MMGKSWSKYSISETLCVYDVYEVTRREKLYEGRKPNRQLPCTFCGLCGCWNLHNFLSSRVYKEDVILLDNNNSIEAICSSEDFKTEILKLKSVIRFMEGTTIRVSRKVCNGLKLKIIQMFFFLRLCNSNFNLMWKTTKSHFGVCLLLTISGYGRHREIWYNWLHFSIDTSRLHPWDSWWST